MYSIGKVNKVRYVTVTEGDTYIYLKGRVNMYLEKGEKYTEPGYQVFDSVDQNLTEKVKVSGTVNTSKVGTYIFCSEFKKYYCNWKKDNCSSRKRAKTKWLK